MGKWCGRMKLKNALILVFFIEKKNVHLILAFKQEKNPIEMFP